MTDTDKDKIIALLRAEIDAWLEDIAVLRAEVRAWRDGVSPSDAATTRMQTRIQKAIAATDAAGALGGDGGEAR